VHQTCSETVIPVKTGIQKNRFNSREPLKIDFCFLIELETVCIGILRTLRNPLRSSRFSLFSTERYATIYARGAENFVLLEVPSMYQDSGLHRNGKIADLTTFPIYILSLGVLPGTMGVHANERGGRVQRTPTPTIFYETSRVPT